MPEPDSAWLSAAALNDLGSALKAQGRFEEAVAAHRQALSIHPDFPEARFNLGNALLRLGRLSEAVTAYRDALRTRPDWPDPWVNLGNALRLSGDLDAAIDAYRRAIALRPDWTGPLNNLANALWDTGRLDDAIDCLRQVALLGTDAASEGNLLYALHYCADQGPAELYAEHEKWRRRHADPLAHSIAPHPNDRSPDRRLRIGWVSPDLCNHPVGLFLLPLLAHHDRDRVETFCYSGVVRPDGLTQRLRSFAACWRDCAALSDAQLADRIRADRIDILVDLALHTRGSRLLTFARRPAPVQATWLGYCGTTGLPAIDWRLTDPYLDPPDVPTPWYAERSAWLPSTYWCYQPLIEVAPAGLPPALRNGFVTFGCLNNPNKITPPTAAAWRDLLRRTPGSHLLVHVRSAEHRRRLATEFGADGVDPSRIRFVDRMSLVEYFERYREIDIALDPFPYPGATTTCDALWAGVPVVTLAGATATSRGGLSILSNVGLPQLVARNVGEYVRLARDLAGDLGRLTELRAGLRRRMTDSPLTDAPRFARDIEALFRGMWREWCGRESSSPSPRRD